MYFVKAAIVDSQYDKQDISKYHNANFSFIVFALTKFARNVLFALAKQARNLGAFKLSRYAFEKLQQHRVPPHMQSTIDIASLSIRSKPFKDSEVRTRTSFTTVSYYLFPQSYIFYRD